MKNRLIELILIFGIISVHALNLSAQHLKIKEEKEINLANDTVNNILMDEATGKYLLHYFSHSKMHSVRTGLPDSILSVAGVIDNNNQRIPLRSIEYCVKYKSDTLTTSDNPINGGLLIRQYVIKNGKADLFYEKNVIFCNSIKALKNGNYLASDNNELFVSSTLLLNDKFEKIAEIKSIFTSYIQMQPYDNGSEVILVNINSDISDTDQKSELVRVNAITGNISNRYYFPDGDIDFGDANMINDHVSITFSKNKPLEFGTRILNSDGSTAWELPQGLFHDRWVEGNVNHQIIYDDKSGVKCRNIFDQKTTWYLSLKHLRKHLLAGKKCRERRKLKNISGNKNLMINKILKISDKNCPEFVAFLHTAGVKKNLNWLTGLCLISDKGKVMSTDVFVSEPGRYELFYVRGELWVMINKKLLKYEIISN